MRFRRGIGWVAHERGQSLVELALAFPLLLLILLGLADFGRAFFYTSAIANAAREGAAYASLNAGSSGTATPTTVGYKVCNETGFVTYSATATCPGLTTTVRQSGSTQCGGTVVTGHVAAQADVTVEVTYGFQLLSSYLVGQIVGSNPVQLRACATYPGLR
jgi:Flp pilus assembly protein TadG